ncbi:MAG: hypothetical protein LQ347_002452 [Umbilicaria vellea]|nr:MAG: hypothetical protein LQ347_002452 [Umbilicaria vellea]
MATEDEASSVPIQKFTRYRSVRNPKPAAHTIPSPAPNAAFAVTEPMKRSMSRYRNNRPVDPVASPPKASLPATTQPKPQREGMNKPSARRETRDVLPLKEKVSLRRQDSEEGESGRGLAKRGDRDELKQPTIDGTLFSAPSQEYLAGDIETPVSAINAGERRVRVKCNQASVFVRVAPSTTTMDVVRSAAEMISENMDIAASTILECIPQLGLERPLRNYEHIRDIMNSWDLDAQNHLIMISSTVGGFAGNLDFRNAARGRPGEKMVYMYHSHQPGKWDKRWITLRSDGQVLLAKKDGGETTNICHLSDFDIYMPTRRQMRKLKPPKKTCYAIKSQQKSSMFLTTANYLHFFSSGDASLAADWYQAVHEWRSWYLVTVLGKGHETPVLVDSNQADQKRRGPIDHLMHHAAAVSPGAVHSPKSDREDHVRRAPLSYSGEASTKGAMNVFPLASQHGLSIGRGASSCKRGEDTFAATGLLGHTYEQRQRAQRDRDTAAACEGPFLPGLLLGETSIPAPHHSPNHEKRPHQGGIMPTSDGNMTAGLKRTSSKWQTSAPLVDLPPYYKALPLSREGKAALPEQLPAGGLIDLATGPEVTSRPGTSSEKSSVANHGAIPGSAVQFGCSSIDGTRNVGHHEGQAYIAGGLLAKAGTGQGGSGTGRGVMTGDRQAKEPMLDLRELSIYAPGSLLARAEKRVGEERAARERVEGREVSIPIGEGF